MGFLAGFVPAWFFSVLALMALIGALVVWANSESPESGKYISPVLGALGLLCGIAAWYGHTHYVVPVNQRAIVINKFEGRQFGETRDSGIIDIPFLAADVYFYPAAKNQEVCNDFTPSVSGGYEVKITLCYYIDASRIDWKSQYEKYNQGKYETLILSWANQLKQPVALAVRAYSPDELTEKRDQVTAAIRQQAAPWFDSQGIPLNSLVLANWDFTDPQVRASFNQTMQSRNQALVEDARYVAAQKRRTVELFEADTENQKLAARAQAQIAYLNSLGITDQAEIMQFLWIQYLQQQSNSPQSIYIAAGNGQAPSVALPAASAPQPTATATAAPARPVATPRP